MLTIYELKPRFQALLSPVTAALARTGITANQVTLTAAILSVALGAALVLVPGMYLLLPVFLFVRMALNAIDGMLARQYGQKSALGGMLNEIGDVVSDAALYLPFALLPQVEPMLVVGVILLAALTEFTGVCAVAVGASRRYDGPMGKSDRAFVFGALGLWIGLGQALGAWVNWLLAVIAVLLVVTCVNRARMALREV
jgi:CDP-diacylglycerol--glycerol-3-phosphate 3-phosphatidyltransferase